MVLKIEDILRLVFIAMVVFFILLLTPIMGISINKLELVVLGLVLTVGMSHGSLDWLLAQHWGLRRNFTESLFFLSAYGLIVLLSLCLWYASPTLGLSIFLWMSILHFASDWKNELTYPATLIIGIVVVALPAALFQTEVLALFSLLAPATKATLLSQILHVAAYIAIAGASIIACQQIKISPYLSAEIFGLLVLGLLLPPLIYFSLYFCVLHATKHWIRMKQIGLYEDLSQALWSVMLPTAFCILVVIWVCHASVNLSFSDAFIRTLFIGLAALTVPHWLLLEVYPRLVKMRNLKN